MALPNDYQKHSLAIRKRAEQFIEEIQVQPGDTVLDLGCGTGELTAKLATDVGPSGKVLGVDPDVGRIELARATHAHGKLGNLQFEVGSSFGFPGEGEANFDLVFSNGVIHRVPNKAELFSKLFSSLKKGGRIFIAFLISFSELQMQLLTHLDMKEALTTISETILIQDKSVECYVQNAGFKIVSFNRDDPRLAFDNIDEYVEFLSGFYGFDFSSVNKERLKDFKPPLIENGKIVGVLKCARLIAIKE